MYLSTPTQGRDRSNRKSRWVRREEAPADGYITSSLGVQKIPEWVIFQKNSRDDINRRRNR